ncbi:MAG: MerR family transcriptional regulator [Candidatus Omnitrophota bacterium]|nr:helix-turn-helix domain-containing protein [Candidatus Omnitrophota bacterium]MBU1929191.1 helix-turn-helix domain-containing protein [Candidatus Omnitrophota bacterium]MBU2035482.1 helix-turn-helix domain-containing protein [Candidatus Omnitrophota bacterium]MBU2258130.1 helix-turn-helix domain-containing protein [Candidatus Omnitrophota bacterium]
MYKTKNQKNHKNISVKEIINKYHISYQTVNHYTDLGLFSVALKKGNIRFYDSCQVRKRLSVITRLASEGYSLYLIRRKLLGV